MCIVVFLHVCMCTIWYLVLAEGIGSLELDLQMVVRLMWVLEIEPRSGRAASALDHGTIFPAHVLYI